MTVSRMAMITFFEGGDLSPDNSLPGQPVYPSQGLPGTGRPDNSLPRPPGHIATLPVFPFDPTHPDGGLPETPGGPSTQPIVPGRKFVVKFLACYGLILVPDNSLPDGEEAQPRS